MPRWPRLFFPLLVIQLSFAPRFVAAAAFPSLTDEDRSLTTVAGQPHASGVIIFQKSQVYFRDWLREPHSRMEMQVRLKILTAEGRKLGEVEIPHNPRVRLINFHGRIVGPSGEEQELTKDAIHQETRSRNQKEAVTRAVFPNVEVGSIIDYRLTYHWDNFYLLDPWHFGGNEPILHSEILYEVPDSLSVQEWFRETGATRIQMEKEQRRDKWIFRAWMDDIPAIPKESLSFPMEDLLSRYLLIPIRYHDRNGPQPLLESWKAVAENFWIYQYASFLDETAQTEIVVRRLVAGKKRREQIRALYEFVRDELGTGPGNDVWINENVDADEVLAKRKGSAAEKSLLLYAMLQAAKIPARLVWVAQRNAGRPEFQVPNPAWFDGILIQVEDGGQYLNLFPVEPGLGFGRLPSLYESTRALVLDRKNPESIILPASPSSDNTQKAVLRLAVDGDGRLSGEGELAFSGHPALRWLGSRDAPERKAGIWLESLTELFPDFTPSDVYLAEDRHEQQLKVTFKLAQRPDKIRGDEVSLQPALPFIATQVLALPPERRQTPVVLPFAGLEETRLQLAWPEEFEIEALPKEVRLRADLGDYSLSIDNDPANRRLEVIRTFARHQREIHGRDKYAVLRTLYERAAQSDAQSLVLVRP